MKISVTYCGLFKQRCCKCIDIDGKGKILALGTSDGSVVLLTEDDLKEFKKITVGNGPESVESVKFSPGIMFKTFKLKQRSNKVSRFLTCTVLPCK